ncbi:hypothetical protein CGH45_06735, partial [Vibrio parahaemolyticus]
MWLNNHVVRGAHLRFF